MIPYANVWSADSGVDLFSRGAELVRATVEAGGLAAYVGADRSYPGYARAVAGLTAATENQAQPDPGVVQYVSSRPHDPNLRMHPSTGYFYITAYSASDTRVSATVCSYAVRPEPLPNEDNRFVGGGFQVELDNTGSNPGQPGIADRDPNAHDPRAHLPPQWDVFGTWKVTTIRVPVSRGDDQPECLPWYQQQFPTFTKVPDYNYLQAPPGYQAPHHPVAPQFPEWIGPTKTG
ncbi:hypothetical protein CRH09_10865 [Nocardia terpenica]|uniref:Uncharacterized protein n=1 Tax=Nocardia terpenica TaxID=455432 RepID=A0A291RH26_9NOCA|nr:hypothetical protein CRH09_10865 [Nocardia terpenica]